MRLFQYILFIAACACFFAACAKEELPLSLQQQEEQQVLLAMNVDIATAADGTVTEVPSVIESALKTIRIYAYTNGKFVGYYYQNVTDNKLNFLMHLTQLTTGVQTVDFYVIGNELSMLDSNKRNFNFPNVDQGETPPTEDYLMGIAFTSLAVDTYEAFPNIDKCTYKINMAAYKNVDAATADDYLNGNDHLGHQMVTEVARVDYNSEGDEVTTDTNGTVAFSLKRPVGKLWLHAAIVSDETEGTATAPVLTILRADILPNGTRNQNFMMPHGLTALLGMQKPNGEGVSTAHLIEASKTVTKLYNKETATDADRTNPDNFDLIHRVTPNTGRPRAYYPYESPFGSPANEWMTPRHYDENGNQVTEGGYIRGNILEIEYSFDGGATKLTNRVYLPPIERNHSYNVYCLINPSGKLSIEYTILDWEQEVWDDLNFEAPNYDQLSPAYSTQSTPYAKPQCWYTGSETSGCFEAKFTMRSPANQKWTPTIYASADEYEIKVYREDDATKKALTADELVASETPYVIRVIPLKPIDEEKKIVRFAISYSPLWDTDAVDLLLINGNINTPNWTRDVTNDNPFTHDPLFLEIIQLKTAP